DQALVNAQGHLLVIRNFLNKTMDAVLSAGNLSPDTVTLYKTNITVGSTNVGLALSSINNQQQQISSDAIALETARGQLNLMLAGSDPQQIAAQAAQVAQAKASVQITLAQIAKSVIRSPIDGTVTKQDAKLGEIAAPNVPLVSVISSDALEIEANIPEADIAKVAIGNTADITFDAFGESVKFSGHVTAIDPAETVIEGVPTYKTTLLLDSTDPRIKPGLTANLDILTNKLENVLMIPQRAIAYRGDKKVVLIPHPGSKTPEEREITTGVRGSDTYIQVLTGLSEGEQIEPSPQ
ncbi:MAG TPA: efflux RND transporter periplasmic adaptor subunit, partial [Candidatus Paceibacterota bacterium]|nr:efflux RND transporter periplasmic adaptor subunit [Candidatus Paceibacterota bacterium]